MTDGPTVEITLRGVDPMDEVVQHVRSRAGALADELGAPEEWAVLIEAAWPRGLRVYRCTVAYVDPERSLDADCSDLDLFATIDRAFAAVRRTLMARSADREPTHVRIRPRPRGRADESSQGFPL